MSLTVGGRLPSAMTVFGWAVLAIAVLLPIQPATAADPCPGDVNGDARVTGADVDAFLPILFDAEVDAMSWFAADANNDGQISIADAVAIELLNGLDCSPPSPAATQPLATPTRTPTPTRTTPPSATPQSQCIVQPLVAGTRTGELSSDDCLRTAAGQQRRTDVYAVSAQPGQWVKIEVAALDANSQLLPRIVVGDSGGQFDRVFGGSPVRFVATTTRPYEVWITSAPGSVADTGRYGLTLTTGTCPLPRAIAATSARLDSFDGSECPDPAVPSSGTSVNLADVFTFVIDEAPRAVSITVQQSIEDSDLDPTFYVVGPQGFQIVAEDDVDDAAPGGFGSDAQGRFLALDPGVYTLVVPTTCNPTRPGSNCRYRLVVSTRVCGTVALNLGATTSTRSGTLYGDTVRTRCAAPLPRPGFDAIGPELGSPADAFRFTGVAGDVVSLHMTGEDDSYLYLLSPANTLLAFDDDTVFQSGSAQIAATLPVAGTYTVIAANGQFLSPPDPEEPGDEGETVEYTLAFRKCSARGDLGTESHASAVDRFEASDCVGFGDLPTRSYGFTGTKGQFVSIAMRSANVDAFVRLLAPDGTQLASDVDALAAGPEHARINRILPVDGKYFVEVSGARDGARVDLGGSLPLDYSIQLDRCVPQTVAPGEVRASFAGGSCTVGDRRGTVSVLAGIPAGGTAVASLRMPESGCAVALSAAGADLPTGGCSPREIDLPLLGGSSGVLILSDPGVTGGAYSWRYSACLAELIGPTSVRQGQISSSDCPSAAGEVADWYVIAGNEALLHFVDSLVGTVRSSAPLRRVFSDLSGSAEVGGTFFAQASEMIPHDRQLTAVLRVEPSPGGARNAYTLEMEPPSLRLF